MLPRPRVTITTVKSPTQSTKWSAFYSSLRFNNWRTVVKRNILDRFRRWFSTKTSISTVREVGVVIGSVACGTRPGTGGRQLVLRSSWGLSRALDRPTGRPLWAALIGAFRPKTSTRPGIPVQKLFETHFFYCRSHPPRLT